MMPLYGHLSPLAARWRGGLQYLLRDEFTTAQVAPLTTPRTCEPGPGTLVIGDSANRLSITGALVTASDGGYTDPRIYSSTQYSQVAGRTLFSSGKASGEMLGIGWSSVNNNYPQTYGVYMAAANLLRVFYPVGGNVGGLETYTFNTYYSVAIILRNPGAYVVVKGGTQFPNWTLIWVNNETQPGSLYAGANLMRANSAIDYLRVADMSSLWSDAYGIATNRVASPIAGEITTSDANALIEMAWTAVTGQVWELSTRRTDDNNRWIVRCDQAGATIKLIECNAGVETERSSAVQTWTNGVSYRVLVYQSGNTIKSFVSNAPKNTYASAAFNNSATGVKTNRAGTNLIAWPRDLSGAALTELERWI